MHCNLSWKLMRIFLGETEQYDGKPAYKAVVNLCKERGIAGATVVRGIYGYGASGVIHSARAIVLSENLPVVVEILDDEEKLMAILPELESIIGKGLVTLEKATVIQLNKE